MKAEPTGEAEPGAMEDGQDAANMETFGGAEDSAAAGGDDGSGAEEQHPPTPARRPGAKPFFSFLHNSYSFCSVHTHRPCELSVHCYEGIGSASHGRHTEPSLRTESQCAHLSDEVLQLTLLSSRPAGNAGAIENLRGVVASLEAAVAFTKAVAGAMATLTQLLASSSVVDVQVQADSNDNNTL